MPGLCAVPGCSGRGGFTFPTNRSPLLQWCVAIRRRSTAKRKGLWKPTGSSRVCVKHFREEDIKYSGLSGRRSILNEAIPSLFLPQTTPCPKPRLGRKKPMLPNVLFESVACVPDFSQEIEIGPDSGNIHFPCAKSQLVQALPELNNEVTQENSGTEPESNVKSTPNFGHLRAEHLKSNRSLFMYYTGFSCYEQFQYVLACLGPAVNDLRSKSFVLGPENEFFLTLMKLRQNKDDKELGFVFGISETTVHTVFRTWIAFLYFELSDLNLWISRDVIDMHMPKVFFDRFPSTRVIIDGTEIPIEKPSNVKEQSATWSTYKNKNTLKVLVGISPKGLITFISESYGGSTSDRQIFERSCLMQNGSFDKNDSVMADRGFNVQDLLCLQHVKLNVPSFLNGANQLPPEKVISDRRIAAHRVHVERLIHLAKTFKILTVPLSHSYLSIGNRIIYVCFALCNFKECIIN